MSNEVATQLGAVLMVWLICGGICAAIASSRNLNVGRWFCAGCFLGIFGVIFALVEDDKSPAATQPAKVAPPAGDALDALKKLADLKERGVLTEAEFADKKKQILAHA